MKRFFVPKLMVPLVLVCVGLGFVYQEQKFSSNKLSSEYGQIDLAAKALDLPALSELSATSKSKFQRAYIEYRLALAAEKAARHPEMKAGLNRSLQLLEALDRQTASAESYALTAAIHLKHLAHSEEPSLHRAALDRALTLGHTLDPENPAILLISAEAMDQASSRSDTQAAMAELLRHEAGIKLDRLCSSRCPVKESAYVWQGLLDSLSPKNLGSDSLLLAKANCALTSAAAGS